MLLSIIIPVFTVESYIDSCLYSCLIQNISTQDYEIIVVNDGSLDMSQSIIEYYVGNYDNIRMVSQINKGPGGARNSGMKIAKGDYYMFLDADDRIQRNCLKILINELKAYKPDCLAFCAANMIEGKPVRRNSYKGVGEMTGLDLLKRGVEPCATFTLWKASFLKEKDLWFQEGIMHEDCEFTPRAYYYAKKVVFSDDIIYYVYPNPQSITRSINPQKSFDLINVVCKNLSNFVSEVDPDDRYVFHNLVSLYLNNAMANILQSDMDKQMELNDVIRSNKGLWKNLRSSTILKYKVEGWLFRMFGNPLRIYRILQFFNKNKKIL